MHKLLATAVERETAGLAAALAPALLALILGAFLIIGTGFAPLAIAHNGAHDSRHAFAFPCH